MENKTALNRMFINGNNSKTRLLNQEINKLGRIGKVILDKINLNLRNATKINQWKNTNVMSSVGSKVLKTSKIVRLFHLILKIFTLQLLRNSYQNA